MLSVASAHIALPVSLLRYVSYGAGSAQGAASRRRPLSPPACRERLSDVEAATPAVSVAQVGKLTAGCYGP